GKTLAPRRVRRRRVQAAAVALVVIGAAIAATLATQGAPTHQPAAPVQALGLVPNALNFVDARTRQVTGHVRLAGRKDFSNPVGDVAFAGGSAWAVRSGQSLVRVDLKTRKI